MEQGQQVDEEEDVDGHCEFKSNTSIFERSPYPTSSFTQQIFFSHRVSNTQFFDFHLFNCRNVKRGDTSDDD